MLRTRLDEGLKTAMRARDQRATSTLRLILAALKDRDIAERGKGNPDGLSDEQILGLLQSMIKQRQREHPPLRAGSRPDLAKQEADEIAVIEQFLPAQLDDGATAEAVDAVLAESGGQDAEGHGPGDGAAEGAVRRADGLRQGGRAGQAAPLLSRAA